MISLCKASRFEKVGESHKWEFKYMELSEGLRALHLQVLGACTLLPQADAEPATCSTFPVVGPRCLVRGPALNTVLRAPWAAGNQLTGQPP